MVATRINVQDCFSWNRMKFVIGSWDSASTWRPWTFPSDLRPQSDLILRCSCSAASRIIPTPSLLRPPSSSWSASPSSPFASSSSKKSKTQVSNSFHDNYAKKLDHLSYNIIYVKWSSFCNELSWKKDGWNNLRFLFGIPVPNGHY